MRAARVTGFDVVLEPPKAASKPSEFGCSNTKTLITGSKIKLSLLLSLTFYYNIGQRLEDSGTTTNGRPETKMHAH